MSGQISVENLDYVRFILLLVQEGSGVVRMIVVNGLEKEGKDLSEFLNRNEEEINRSKGIYQEQKQILYPPSGQTADISNWDISLLAFFARRFFTTRGSEDQRAVKKITAWRNKYFHSGTTSVDDGDFEDLSNVIRTISHKYSPREPPRIDDVINGIKELELHPALEHLKTLDLKLSEHIEGMFGMINGQLMTIQRDVQQTNQDVRNMREEIRRVTERDDSEAILPVYTVHGVVYVRLRPENQEALEIVMNNLLSLSLQQTGNRSPIEEKVANISLDIRSIGGEVVALQEGSVVFVINCVSLTALMYVIDYFYSPKIQCRLDDIVKELQKETGQDVELVADILPQSLEEILRKLKEGDNTEIKHMSKVRAILEKRKRKMSQSGLALEQGQQTLDRKGKMSELKKLLSSIDNHAKRCGDVIKEMKEMFNRKTEEIRQYPNVKAWIKELEEIENKLEVRRVEIAVIGNTGEGKSSLMNALLDRDVLPTSGMKACTATVVEVVQSETEFFDAEIEFLEEKEWFDELRKLCEDLTDENGIVTKTPPDRNSVIYNSYCKMVALYGDIDTFDILSKKTDLTKWLGQTIPIPAAKLDEFKEFKKEVEKYVEVKQQGTDDCFWPIVKRVHLKLPECDVCSSSAVLVDLPGRGDSDEARNAIAKSHLEKCDHIWIVSSINRAINDRTAQELLGEQLRSQFYMNGQLDAVSFICTKTDVLRAEECQREFEQLEDLTKELNKKVSELDKQKRDLSKKIKDLNLSIKEDQKDLNGIKSCLEDDEDESEDILKEVEDIEGSIKDKEQQRRKLDSELLELKDQQNEKRKAIDEKCAMVRNEYCEARIKQQFASSYEEIKRASIPDSTDKKEPEQLQIKNLTNNLKVFCCSSKEYQSLKDDAGPKVFSNVDDTQIPKLRNFVHELTSTRKKESLTDTLSCLDGFVSSVQNCLFDKEVMKPKQSHTKVTIGLKSQTLKASINRNLEKLRSDLDDIFDKNLILKLRDGASAAAEEANEISNRWGTQRREGGLHHRTYQAAVKRRGIYLDVNFNEELAQPLLTKIAFTWGNTFMAVSGSVWKALDEFKDVVLQERKKFLDELLLNLGISEDASKSFREAQDCFATIKINVTVKGIQGEVSLQHRAIPGVAAPHIQLCLSDVYKECAEIKGKGMLGKVKSKLSSGINEKRRTMFVEIADKMTKQLHSIKEDIIDQLTKKSNDLMDDLNTALEPLWDDNTILRRAFSEDVGKFSLKVKGILEDFQSATEGPSQKRQKLQASSGTEKESPEPMQGCSK